MTLTLTTHKQDDHTVVTVAGDLDVFTAPQLRDFLRDTFHNQRVALILDLFRVDFIDSSGLGVLVGTYKRAQALGGSLRLARPPSHVEQQLITTGLHTALPPYPTIEAAATAAS